MLLAFTHENAGQYRAEALTKYESSESGQKFMIKLNIKPWCTCIERGAWKPQDGYRLDPPSGLWVHPRCGKPSYMNYQRHTDKQPIIKEDRDMGFMKGEVDIYQKELAIWAKSVISDELDWDLTDE